MNDRTHLLKSVLTWGGVKELLGDDLYARAWDAVDAQEAENQRLLAQNVRDDLRLRETFAKNQRLRDALEQIATEWEGNIGTGQMLTDFCREALAGDAE